MAGSRISIAVLCLVFIVLSATRTGAESILFHIKTSLAKDDAQICVAPNVALAALEFGDDVTLLFDGSAVTSITQGWGWFVFGSTTPMDKAGLPERERKSLSEQFGIPMEKIPKNYGDYLEFVRDRGAKIVVNGTMLTLYNIDPKTVDDVAQPLELMDMLNVFKKADRVLVY